MKFKSSNQRKAVMSKLKSAGFTPLSAKFMTQKCMGQENKLYSHPKYGLLLTPMTKKELNQKYGKGWVGVSKERKPQPYTEPIKVNRKSR